MDLSFPWAPGTSPVDLCLHFLACVSTASDFMFCFLANCLRSKGGFHWDPMNRHSVNAENNAQDENLKTQHCRLANSPTHIHTETVLIMRSSKVLSTDHTELALF